MITTTTVLYLTCQWAHTSISTSSCFFTIDSRWFQQRTCLIHHLKGSTNSNSVAAENENCNQLRSLFKLVQIHSTLNLLNTYCFCFCLIYIYIYIYKLNGFIIN